MEISYSQLYYSLIPDYRRMEFFEDKLRGLESDNFDMKLQMYYSNIKAGSNITDDLLSTPRDGDVINDISEGRDVHPSASQDVNAITNRGKRNLESELRSTRAEMESDPSYLHSRGKATATPTATVGTSGYPSENPVQVDVNRKHEREAAVAIAAHDALLIRRLESEISNLQLKHQHDLLLIKEGALKVAGLTRENTAKDLLLSSRAAASQSFDAKMVALSALLQDSEKHLEIERKANRISAEKVHAARIAEEGHTTGRTLEGKDNIIIKSENLPRPPLLTNPSSNCMPNKLISSRNNLSPKNSVARTSSNDTSSQLMSTLSSGRTSYNSPAFTPRPQSFLRTFEPGKSMEDLRTINEQLRIEVVRLSDMLNRERMLSEGQEEALNQVRESAEEITLLEAEEIARLETEIIKCSDEKDYWRKKCKLAEAQGEQLSVQLHHLKQVRFHNNSHESSPSTSTEKEMYVSKYIGDKNKGDTVKNHSATVCVDIGYGRSAYHPAEMIR